MMMMVSAMGYELGFSLDLMTAELGRYVGDGCVWHEMGREGEGRECTIVSPERQSFVQWYDFHIRSLIVH